MVFEIGRLARGVKRTEIVITNSVALSPEVHLGDFLNLVLMARRLLTGELIGSGTIP